MSPSKPLDEISALRQLALDDVMSLSDEDLLKEAAAAGEDVQAMAFAMTVMLRETVAGELRQRLVTARQGIVVSASAKSTSRQFPSFDEIKQRVREAFAARPELRAAWREGKEQTESDWQSMYEDLIELGAIAPDEDSH